jgi:tetratricopeptide (TPR) repeat protein
MRIHHHVLAMLLVTLAAHGVHADPTAAAVHAEAGKQAFAEERFAEAISEFRAANALDPDPKLLYAIAQAQRMAGDCAGAIESYKAFLATKPDAKLSEYSEANIARCKEDLAKLAAKAKTAPPEPVPVKPPPNPPTPEPAAVALTVPPPDPVDQGGGRSWTRDWIGHALVGGGVATAAVGAVLVVSGRNAAAAANDASDYASFLEARAAASSALTKQRIGIGAAIVGVGLIVGGVIHYRLGSSGRELRVTAVPTEGGAAVFARVDL